MSAFSIISITFVVCQQKSAKYKNNYLKHYKTRQIISIRLVLYLFIKLKNDFLTHSLSIVTKPSRAVALCICAVTNEQSVTDEQSVTY